MLLIFLFPSLFLCCTVYERNFWWTWIVKCKTVTDWNEPSGNVFLFWLKLFQFSRKLFSQIFSLSPDFSFGLWFSSLSSSTVCFMYDVNNIWPSKCANVFIQQEITIRWRLNGTFGGSSGSYLHKKDASTIRSCQRKLMKSSTIMRLHMYVYARIF